MPAISYCKTSRLRASGAAISKLTQIHYDYWTDYFFGDVPKSLET